MNNQPNCYGTINERVKIGKVVEADIVSTLRANNLVVSEASLKQDMFDKIDCWVTWQGERLSTQIKYRETGRDILFEVFHTFLGFDHPQNRVGRDMKGKCHLYAVKLGKMVYLFKTDRLKKIVEDLLQAAKNIGWGEFRSVKLRGSELKLQVDPSDNRSKVCAYISPDSIPHFKLACQ